MHYLEFESWFKTKYPNIEKYKSKYSENDLYYSGNILVFEHALQTNWCSYSSNVHQEITKDLSNLEFSERMNLLWQISIGIFKVDAFLSGYNN